jgi:hypothetical protein
VIGVDKKRVLPINLPVSGLISYNECNLVIKTENSGELNIQEFKMNDRRNPDLPEEPHENDDEKRPLEVGDDPGMVGREPVYKERTDPDEVPVERYDEGEQPEEYDRAQPTDTDPTADPLPDGGQPVQVGQPFQGEPVKTGGHLSDVVPSQTTEHPVGAPEPILTGTGQPATRTDRRMTLPILIGIIIFCIVVVALFFGGVFP